MPDQEDPAPLLVLRNASKHYPIRGTLFARQAGVIRAVDGVDLSQKRAETLGLVGESGCGTVHAWARDPSAGGAHIGGDPL